jgi:hypothetical protein
MHAQDYCVMSTNKATNESYNKSVFTCSVSCNVYSHIQRLHKQSRNSKVSNDDMTTKDAFLNAIDSRIAHETTKNAANDSIVDTLKKIRKSCDNDALCNVLIASNVDAEYINRAERVNARFNVYSAEKVINTARAIAKVQTLNHYSLAIVRSALALEAADSVLSHNDAVAACSLSIKHRDAKRAALIKTARYQKHVAAQTASTQASSSINALQVFNVFSETKILDQVAYALNRDNENCKKLIEIAQAQ